LTAASLGLALAGPLVCQEPASPAPSFRLVDDRGQEIREPLQVCLVRGLERTCQEIRGPDGWAPAGAFDLVTVEGPGHGPASLKRAELFGPGRRDRIVVPRKATLKIGGLPSAHPVSLSLYPQDDPDFRRPAVKASLTGTAELRVPAGSFVLSLTLPGTAPDLHLLDLMPGGGAAVAFQARAGWSLLLRAVSQPDGDRLRETRVELRPSPGYGESSQGSKLAVTERFGIVAFAGLESQIAVATLRRPGYVERQVAGLSASPGSFEFREIALERPGSVRMTITLRGKPAAGARCRIQDFTPSSRYGRQVPALRALFDGEVGKEGVCMARAIPAGSYNVRVLPPRSEVEGGAGAEAARLATVGVEAGRESALEIDLEPMLLGGSVLRGVEPAAGYKVRIGSPNAGRTEEEVAAVTTDDEGEYRATLWTEGEYFVSLFTPAGRLVESKRALVAGGESRCDFRLSRNEIQGIVRDEAGRVVAEAAVNVAWSRTAAPEEASDGNLSLPSPEGEAARFQTWRFFADAEGRFTVPLQAGSGVARLTAAKQGFRPSSSVEIAVDEAAPPQAVELVLASGDDLAGILLTSAGAPVAGGWIAAFELLHGLPATLGTAQTGAARGAARRSRAAPLPARAP
jgi:hypothetical protein